MILPSWSVGKTTRHRFLGEAADITNIAFLLASDESRLARVCCGRWIPCTVILLSEAAEEINTGFGEFSTKPGTTGAGTLSAF
ncbi:hypothetical protein [Pseudomonas brassicacearum]|uniref:hypothetical protein n=1 Tax=Pseudomonas brassicacearum TaxID=930166 RepID=UPI0002E3AA12|nr:hypothetical protein [Pseudomonas brassicacearum]